jgi:hypothetical protein
MGWPEATDQVLARVVLERGIALIYVIAFTVALNQFPALLGQRGILPVTHYVARVPFSAAPSLFHLRYSDRLLQVVCWVCSALAGALALGASALVPAWASLVAWLVLWLSYLSIVNVGQTFYGFGWESLLLEAGFLAAFLGPATTAPPALVLWLFRWLVFRLEFGAGLIKLRGDPCWRDLTCLYYHHETQPMPNPLSWYFHHLPKPLHRLEVAANHLTQLVIPFGLFMPQPVAGVAGLAVIVTQSWLVASGNFSWLNALTIVCAFSALPDSMLGALLPIEVGTLVQEPIWHRVLVGALTITFVALSYFPVRNLVSRRQLMNYSFNRLHLVNTYGAFGSITRVRYEVVIEATDDPESGRWLEYRFKGKPGDPARRPPQIAPYHLRLDWLMWFVAISPSYGYGWFDAFLAKLLAADPKVLKLLRHAPFGAEPPAAVRAVLYRYRYTTPAERAASGHWWVREPAGVLVVVNHGR